MPSVRAEAARSSNTAAENDICKGGYAAHGCVMLGFSRGLVYSPLENPHLPCPACIFTPHKHHLTPPLDRRLQTLTLSCLCEQAERTWQSSQLNKTKKQLCNQEKNSKKA